MLPECSPEMCSLRSPTTFSESSGTDCGQTPVPGPRGHVSSWCRHGGAGRWTTPLPHRASGLPPAHRRPVLHMLPQPLLWLSAAAGRQAGPGPSSQGASLWRRRSLAERGAPAGLWLPAPRLQPGEWALPVGAIGTSLRRLCRNPLQSCLWCSCHRALPVLGVILIPISQTTCRIPCSLPSGTVEISFQLSGS